MAEEPANTKTPGLEAAWCAIGTEKRSSQQSASREGERHRHEVGEGGEPGQGLKDTLGPFEKGDDLVWFLFLYGLSSG
jgi:hypothetical protein